MSDHPASDAVAAVTVEVDEPKINATGQGADWWFWYRKYDDSGPHRIAEYGSGSPMGARCTVECESQDHADQFIATALEKGVPKTAVRIRARRKAGRV